MGSRPHGVTCFGRDDQFVAIGGQVFAEDTPHRHFGRPWCGAIIIREVEMRDAEVEGAQGNGAGRRVIVDASEVMPKPEGNLWQM